MREIIHRLGSMKIAVGLLVVILFALAAGTIVEARYGTPAAAQYVYSALWFRLLLTAFAVNVACSLIDLFPWGWQRAGFVMTHGAMLLVLAGALATDRLKIEGSLALWEGEESARFDLRGAAGAPPTMELPFKVRLEAFEIDYYQGTRRPAMFRSRVVVTNASTGHSFPAVIEMNRELSHAGYRLFQSSYEQRPDKDRTVLTVSRDPGQPIVFAGYTLLMIGMVTVLSTRIAQRRAAARSMAPLKKLHGIRRVAALLLGAGIVAAACALAVPPVQAAQLPDPVAADRLRSLPVQHDGRVMPLDTLAREAVWNVTGRWRWNGVDPVALALGWSLDPDAWAAEKIIPIGSDEVAEMIGAPAGTTHLSFMDYVNNAAMMKLFTQARGEARAERPLSPMLKAVQKVENRLIVMQGFLQKTAIRPVPNPHDPAGQWAAPATLHGVTDLTILQEAPPAGVTAGDPVIAAEVSYNRVRPSRLSWWILVPATLVSLLAFRIRNRWLDVL
ncbi:MAG TPA: cytochrome c biogenesis protein ResB, partial [Candidatus Polarisedimenticolia bacterium]|nr:cytochrome c biogenesis protein ResB [Candidatus Polarisedimenticolia bacterium]